MCTQWARKVKMNEWQVYAKMQMKWNSIKANSMIPSYLSNVQKHVNQAIYCVGIQRWAKTAKKSKWIINTKFGIVVTSEWKWGNGIGKRNISKPIKWFFFFKGELRESIVVPCTTMLMLSTKCVIFFHSSTHYLTRIIDSYLNFMLTWCEMGFQCHLLPGV